MEKVVGQKIRERRKTLKMNQETLAKKSKVSRVTISALENGKYDNVLVGTLTAIADALECNIEFFLT